jgi:hypothetical protein
MAALINEMQACQGLIEFLDQKLDSAPSSYSKADIKTVRKGLEAYDEYIQQEIVSPGLLEFNGGDKGKAKDMQKQVDAYKESIVKQMNQRFPQDQLFMDHAIQLNNCAKQAVPSGDDLEALKDALNTMITLSQQN